MAGAIADCAGVPPAGVVVLGDACKVLTNSGAGGFVGVTRGCALCVNSTAIGPSCLLSAAGFGSAGLGAPLAAAEASLTFAAAGAATLPCGACATASSTAARISISSLKLWPA